MIILSIAGKLSIQQQKWQERQRSGLVFQLLFVHLNSSVNINKRCCSEHYHLFITIAVYYARIWRLSKHLYFHQTYLLPNSVRKTKPNENLNIFKDCIHTTELRILEHKVLCWLLGTMENSALWNHLPDIVPCKIFLHHNIFGTWL